MLGTPRFTPTLLTSPRLYNNSLTLYRMDGLCDTGYAASIQSSHCNENDGLQGNSQINP